MRKVLVITGLVLLSFVIEFLLFNLFGRWFVPNLSILLIIFCDLYLGIRYSLFSAFIAGILKDSFSISAFGIHLYAFILCAYMTNITKRYIYHQGSRTSKLLLVFFICSINYIIQYLFLLMFNTMNLLHTIQFVFFPQILLTLLVATYVFHQLRQCASKLFV